MRSGRYYATQYVSLSSNVTVFAAQVNQGAFTASFAELTYANVATGAYTDIAVGMTVLISRTNSKRAAFHVGRIRKTPTSDTLYIDETSAPIQNEDYIFVINDFRIGHKLARDVDGVQYKDYDLTFAQPSPVLHGLQSAYAGFASGSPEGFTVAFSASAYAVADGATINAGSWSWTLPSGTTVTAGSTSSASVTVRFDPAADEYWVKVTVADSGGRTATRWIAVWSHNDTYPPAVGFNGATITLDGDVGYTASISGFNGIDNVLDNTLIVIWNREWYDDTEQSIGSTVRFVGRLLRERTGGGGDPTHSTLPKPTEFECEGIGAQLAHVTAPLLALRNNTNPTVWDEIDKLTIWRAAVHVLQAHSNVLELHDLTFDSTADTFVADLLGTQGGNLLAVANDLGESINAKVEFAPSGEIRLVRDARYLDEDERNALTTVCDLTARDGKLVDIEREHIDRFGRCEAVGGFYLSGSDYVVPLLSVAPGVAQGRGGDNAPLTRQILQSDVSQFTAQGELNARSGNHFELSNTREKITVDMPASHHFLVPSLQQWYTWTLTTTLNNRGISYDTNTRWLLRTISVTHDNIAGTATVQATYTIETEGDDGQTLEYPTPNSLPISEPFLPVLPTYPSFPEDPGTLYPPDYLPPGIDDGGAALLDGNTVVVWDVTANEVQITTEVKRTNNPTWRSVKPGFGSGETVRQVVPDRDGAAYCLSRTDSQSRVWYTENITALSVVWSAGEWVDGQYDKIAATDTPGEVYIYDRGTSSGGGGGAWEEDRDLKPSVPADITVVTGIHTVGVGVNGGTFEILWAFAGDGDPDEFVFTLAGIGSGNPTVTIWTILDTVETQIFQAVRGNGTHTVPITGTIDGIRLRSVRQFNHELPFVSLNGSDNDPFSGGSGEALVCYSSNNGEDFSSPISVGSSPAGFGGFDTIRIGSASVAGRAGQAEISTSAGGGYSNYGEALDGVADPDLIVIPRFQFNSTEIDNTETGTPHVLIGSALLDASDDALWRLVDGTLTDITPNNGGNEGLVVSANCITMPWFDGGKIAGVFDFSGTLRLYTSASAGDAWSDRSGMNDGADYVRMRRGDEAAVELYIANGSLLSYSPDFGSSLVGKTVPITIGTLSGVEVIE